MRLWERHPRRWLAGLLLVLVTASALVWFVAGGRDRRSGDRTLVPSSRPGRENRTAAPPSTRDAGKPTQPGFELKGTRLKVMDPVSGRTAWELTLSEAELAESGAAQLSGVAAVYHNEDGTTSSLSARQGSLDANQQSLVFSGEVRLTAPNGSQLQAAELRWEAGQSGFVAKAPAGGQVTLTRGTSVLRAGELRGDLALKKVKATGGVRLSGQ